MSTAIRAQAEAGPARRDRRRRLHRPRVRGDISQARARRHGHRDDGPRDEPRGRAGDEPLLCQASTSSHGVTLLTGKRVGALIGDDACQRRRMHGRHAGARGSGDRRHRAGAEHGARERRGISPATTASRWTSIAAPAIRTSTRSATAAATRARAMAAASGSNPWTTPSSRRGRRRRTSAASARARQDAVVLVRPVRTEAADRRAQPALRQASCCAAIPRARVVQLLLPARWRADRARCRESRQGFHGRAQADRRARAPGSGPARRPGTCVKDTRWRDTL